MPTSLQTNMIPGFTISKYFWHNCVC